MTAAGSLAWFARHELTLAWRDWLHMAGGGKARRERGLVFGLAIFAALVHWLAYAILTKVMPGADLGSKAVLITLTASLLLTFSMMLSQAIEHVTRAFYARADLDLILSSPASSRDLFAIRIASIAVAGAAMTAVMVMPFVNVAVWIGGAQWLAAYAVIAGTSAFATGLAVLITLALFRLAGAKRARLISQIVAAVVGAALLIGLQVAAVFAYGNLSRFSVLGSASVNAIAPGLDSLLWLPARALTGDRAAALVVVVGGISFLAAVIAMFASDFSSHALAAAGLSESDEASQRVSKPFRHRSTIAALRHKELMLLGRDPWLVSQSLMQILYLLPPALLLWRDMGQDTQIHVLLAPVLVMAFGQLAGGLSWLAISGEDAPELVATAPLTSFSILRAKVEAVLCVIAIASGPLVLGLAFFSIPGAAATGLGVAAASIAAVVIQLWFKSTAKRSQFRKRQTATKIATLSEAFSSIFWAGATGVAAAGSWLALIFVALALLTLWLTWLIRPVT